MAFTVEDGTGVAGANAYVTVVVADTHHADRGNTSWAEAPSTDRQIAIVRATDYVDKRFGKKFRGFKQTKTQGLEWPRLSAFDNDDYLLNSPTDGVPRQLQKAIAEYAFIALNITLLPLPALPFSTRDPVTGAVTSNVSGQVSRTKDVVGPIEEERWYQNTASQIVRAKPGASESDMVSSFNLPEYPVADEWLQELLTSGASIELRRA